MARRYSLSELSAIAGRPIFFDTNILIYIFWPTGSMKWEREYSRLFGSILKQKNEKIVDFTVISEVVNITIRTEHEKYLAQTGQDKKKLPFKRYRDSEAGKEALDDVYRIIETMLKNFSITGKAFLKADIDTFLSVDTMDFNDKAIFSLCKENNYILLTNDMDFSDADIEIVTSNPSLLGSVR